MLQSIFRIRSWNNRPKTTRLTVNLLESRTMLSASQTLGGIEFMTDGQFTTETVGGQVRVATNTPVEVGLVPAAGQSFKPLLRLTGGVEFIAGNGGGQFTAEGEVVGIFGGVEIPLAASANRELSVGDLLGHGAGIGGKSISVAGASFTLSGIELNSDAIELQGHLAFPQLAGLTVAVEGSDHVVIDRTGVHLTGLDVSFSGASFERAGMGFNLESMHVRYSTETDSFAVSGDGAIHVAGKEIGIAIGSESEPGIEISHGKLTKQAASVTGSFNLLGLAVDADRVGLKYDAVADAIDIYGGIHVSTPGKVFDHVGATLGTIDAPGLVIEHGQVKELSVAVDGAINLYGLKVSSKDLCLHYDAQSGLLQVVGGLGFQMGPKISASAALTGEGMTIDTRTGAVAVNGVTFTADADFGPVQVHDLAIEYQKTPTGSVWAASGTVQLAPGVTVDGAFAIADGKLSRIGIDYDANGGPGIPIGDTGAYLTRIGGEIDNLDNPTSIVVSLNAQVTYGKTVRFLGKDYGLFVADGKLTVANNSLELYGDVQLVGGLLGEGTAHVNLDWTNKKTEVHGNLSMYDGVFTYGGGVTITSTGDVIVDATGGVHLPKLPEPIQELASFLPASTLAQAKLRLEIHPGRPADTFVAVEASALGTTGKFRYDAGKGFSFGTYSGLTQWATGVIDAAGMAITKAYDRFGNLTERWADKTGNTWKRVTQSFNPGQIGITYVTEYSNGVRYLRDTFQFKSQLSREVWQASWDAGVVGAQYVKTVFGSNARTITTTLKAGGNAVRETVYASGRRMTEYLDAAGDVVETYVKDSANSAWKKTKSALGGFKFW
jgi:hypothetical protein